MPYKYNQPRRHLINKASPTTRDWSNYSKSLKQRSDISFWLSEDVIEQWYEKDRVYDDNGTPLLYNDMAILTVHEIRQVFKLPLRQCEGFVNSLFALLKVELRCPCFSALSKRLNKLHLKRPFYRYAHHEGSHIKAIALDSSGLKCYGQEEWRQEKYGLDKKKTWRKLHITVDNHHIIQSSELTDRFIQAVSVVDQLVRPIPLSVRQITADGAYDTNPTYCTLRQQFPSADVVIPPQKDAVYHKDNEFYRNRNILEAHYYGRTGWQKRRDYGKRNYSECAIYRYKRILGDKLHARKFHRQQQEALIGCSILNKMMCITLANTF